MDERLEPVVVEKVIMYRPLVTSMFVMIIVCMGLYIVLLFQMIRVYLETEFGGFIAFVSAMIVLVVPMIFFMARSMYVRSFEDSIVLEVDRLRSMRGGRVLMDLLFDPRTRVDFRLHREPISGMVEERYFFHRGWWIYPICAKDYSHEDFSRMLPVVEAAVRKHGMPTGRSLEIIMQKRGA